ncbi:MAG: hypothetical protein DWQ53_17710 [Microcystis flos-aquae DF17]|uniref:Uncharacterized protein n=1 Tax=Microcystis aeruginosa (strain NIES-843 / IAM M-2473) TaxID=449447 RepID=B0JQE8_MICAN|nr:MAG: hypothetical protein DWQ53_17710 [Microcystis flos-aquae DF17]BAG00607.1 unknown protein [Microcystis aeruginosa NIES-843]
MVSNRAVSLAIRVSLGLTPGERGVGCGEKVGRLHLTFAKIPTISNYQSLSNAYKSINNYL